MPTNARLVLAGRGGRYPAGDGENPVIQGIEASGDRGIGGSGNQGIRASGNQGRDHVTSLTTVNFHVAANVDTQRSRVSTVSSR